MRNAAAAVTDDAFAVIVVVADAWSMARLGLGTENGTMREINQIRVGANLHGVPEHYVGWRCFKGQ